MAAETSSSNFYFFRIVLFFNFCAYFSSSKLTNLQSSGPSNPLKKRTSFDFHVCPKACFCRPKISPLHSIEQFEFSTPVDKFPDSIIDHYDWTAACEYANISSLGVQLPSGENAFSLVELPRKTVHLSLKFNNLKILHKKAFAALPNLQVLDLSHNEITILAAETFVDLKNLKTLNLTSNRLHTINATILAGLDNLEKLIIAQNPLPFIPTGSLKRLDSLNFLDISSQDLTCDCNMRWLWKWVRKKKIKLSPTSKCMHPKRLRGTNLKKVKRKDLKCGKFDPRLFEIEPSEEARLVFPGDSLSLTCRISMDSGQSVSLEWFHSNGRVGPADPNRQVTTKRNSEANTLETSIKFDRITPADGGVWRCRAETMDVGGAVDRNIELIVMSSGPISGVSCPPEVRSGEKGKFAWPATPAGGTAKLLCPFGSINCTSADCKAHRVCGANGIWKRDSNSTICEFVSRIIRLGRNELFGNEAAKLSRQTRWEKFENFTRLNISDLKSPTELNFLTSFMEKERSLGRQVEIRALSNLITGNRTEILRQAEAQFNLTSRLRKWIENFSPDSLVAGVLTSNNLGVCENIVRQSDRSSVDGFYAAAFAKNNKATFYCGEMTENQKLSTDLAISSLEFPSNLVKFALTPSDDAELSEMPVYLFIIWLKNGDIFSQNLTTDSGRNLWVTESQILGVKLEKLLAKLNFIAVKSRSERDVGNLTENSANSTDWDLATTTAAPARRKTTKTTVTFRFTIGEQTRTVRLGYWNESGRFWAPVDGKICINSRVFATSDGKMRTVFLCKRKFVSKLLKRLISGQDSQKYAYFTAVQLDSELSEISETQRPIRLLPWMYAACGLLSICLLVAVVTYVTCARSIGISSKLRHCLINSWLSITILCLTFTLGIDKVEIKEICFAVSVGLHYAFLVAILWTVLTLSCFLPPGGVLYGAVLIPAGIILLAGLILLISGCCLLSARRALAAAAPAPQVAVGTEPELDESSQLLVHSQQRNGHVTRDAQRSDVISVTSSIVDSELDDCQQLRWAGVVMVGYALSCVAAGAYFARPALIFHLIPYYAEISSGIYTALLTVLSLTVFFYHVIARPSVRSRLCVKENNAKSSAPRQMNGTKRDVGVGMGTPANEHGRRGRSEWVTAPPPTNNVLITPESERMMKSMAKKYHLKQKMVAKAQDEGNYEEQGGSRSWGYGMNGSAVLPSDLASEIIFEEEELNYIPSPTSSSQNKISNFPRSNSKNSQGGGRTQKKEHHSESMVLSPKHEALLLVSTSSEPAQAKIKSTSTNLIQERMTKSEEIGGNFHDYVNVNDLSPVQLVSPRKSPSGFHDDPIEGAGEVVKLRKKKNSGSRGSESSKSSSRQHSETRV